VSPAAPQIIVVVTFYSRGGTTERLATAAAVGAVQARAGIRLRRLADPDPAATIARFPAHAEALRRMQKEYVPPREVDLAAADVLVLASPADVGPASPEWAPYVEMLRRLQTEGKLQRKVGAVVDTGASALLAGLLQEVGLVPITGPESITGDTVARAIALGRAAVAAAHRLRR
jgi:multimeric flavodoxin WrbA